MKVMTIVGTRPEVIKLSRVIPELDRHTRHILVHTGQNYDYQLNRIFFDGMDIRKPDYFLNAAKSVAARTIGNIIGQADQVMAKESPDALLLLGDTNSCLSAIAAKRRKIPIFHMEAGNRCFDERVPEEVNRRIVDHISDINMPYTEHARRYLLREGIRPETIIKTGSPMREVLSHYKQDFEASEVLQRLELRAGEYFLVSSHREENVDSAENFTDFLATLATLTKKYRKRVIVSTHPRTRKRLHSVNRRRLPIKVEFLKPLGFADYVQLQCNACCVLSDSGTLTEESSILAFPAVMLRQAHERPEGMDEGTLIMSGLTVGAVCAAIDATVAQYREKTRPFRTVSDYEPDNVSSKVVRIILSYTDYVNRTVWRK